MLAVTRGSDDITFRRDLDAKRTQPSMSSSTSNTEAIPTPSPLCADCAAAVLRRRLAAAVCLAVHPSAHGGAVYCFILPVAFAFAFASGPDAPSGDMPFSRCCISVGALLPLVEAA